MEKAYTSGPPFNPPAEPWLPFPPLLPGPKRTAACTTGGGCPIVGRAWVGGSGFAASVRFGSRSNDGCSPNDGWVRSAAPAPIAAAAPIVAVHSAPHFIPTESGVPQGFIIMTNFVSSAVAAVSRPRARLRNRLWTALPILALVAFLPARGEAQLTTGALELGVISARDFTGFTGVGALEARTFLLFARSSADVGFGSSDSSVERRGDTCRDTTTGEAVNDSRCVSLDGGLTFRAGLDFPIQDKRLQLGVGYRLAKSASGGLGSASLRWPRGNSGWWGVTLEAGNKMVRATGGIGFSRGQADR